MATELSEERVTSEAMGQRGKVCVTCGNQHASEALRALGVAQPDQSTPPEGREWLM